MKKKLKIKFWKTERALAVQVVEQKGLPKWKHEGVIRIVSVVSFDSETLYLRGNEKIFDFDISPESFESNQDRDKCFDKITQAITDELFTNGQTELKVGEYCKVRNHKDYDWETLKLLAILPNPQKYKYVCESRDDDTFANTYMEARPIFNRTEPKVEISGEVITYTWEE